MTPYAPKRATSSSEGSTNADPADYTKKRWAVILGIICLVITTLGTALLNIKELAPKPEVIAEQQPDSDTSPAPTRNPPLLIEAVSELRSNVGGGDFAVAEKVTLGAPEQDILSKRGTNRRAFGRWLKDMKAAAISPAIASITVVGNWDEEISISDIQARSECSKSYHGTYFVAYSAGSGDTARIGFNLDNPEPRAKEVAFHGGVGTITNTNYFEANKVSLRRYESTTLSLWMFSSTRTCRFSLELELATSRGRFLQPVQEPSGSIFRVTPATDEADRYARTYVEEVPDHGPSYWRER